MNASGVSKQTARFPEEFGKEPVKQQNDSINKPELESVSVRLTSGISFPFNLQPSVEGVHRWGLNE